MEKIILSGPSLFTNDPSAAYYDRGGILIENGFITQVGDANRIREYNPDVSVENIGNGFLTPGLINLHHHLYSSFARGWNPGGPTPSNFKEILERIWWRLDQGLNSDDIYYSALVGLSDSVLSGVTSVVDHHSSQRIISGSLKKIADAFNLIGLRGSICFELSNRAGKEAFENGLIESVEALSRWPLGGSVKMLTAMVGLHASLTLSDDNLKTISGATASLSAGYHFHLAEDKIDQDVSLGKYGSRATRRFAKFGLLNERSLAVHGVHLDKNEIELLRSSGTNLAICPRSNQNNAVGFAGWWNYNGVTIGLGTDGIGSDMLHEAKSALYLTRHDKADSGFGFSEIGEMIIKQNPAIFEKLTGMKTGRIASGYPADIVLWRYSPPTPLNKDNILSHYLYGLCDLKADSVWINGKNIVKDGRFTNFDYANMLTEARALARSLWERI